MFINLELKVSKKTMSIRSIALSAILLALLVVQEELLAFIPNVQLTVVLIMLYAYFMPLGILIPLISGYVIIDSLYNGSFNFIYLPAMFMAWLFLGVMARLIRNKPDYVIVIFAVIFGFVYGWFYLPARMIEQGVGIFWPYLKADFVFEVVMSVNNLITVLAIYFPLRTTLRLYFEGSFLFYK